MFDDIEKEAEKTGELSGECSSWYEIYFEAGFGKLDVPWHKSNPPFKKKDCSVKGTPFANEICHNEWTSDSKGFGFLSEATIKIRWVQECGADIGELRIEGPITEGPDRYPKQ